MIISPVPGTRHISARRPAAPPCRTQPKRSPRLAREITRDHDSLSRTQVMDLLDGLHRTLLDRFGESDEHRLTARLPDAIQVPVRFHVIASGDQGRLSKGEVDGQMAALNAAYSGSTGGAGTGVSFRLISVEVTDNADWFTDPLRYERPLKTALRRGGVGTLNLYSAAVGSVILGVSTFPQWYSLRPVLDGVMIDYRTVPGGSNPRFNRGYTAVHEVGHWLGLLHTFENGCLSPGDAVDDTPYEREPTLGCPVTKDTCPAPGTDPVHNFMDYGFDACMNEFTPGQGSRIRAVWAAYRTQGSDAGVKQSSLGTTRVPPARTAARAWSRPGRSRLVPVNPWPR
jgi:Pregnancy-associated plasma protein-A